MNKYVEMYPEWYGKKGGLKWVGYQIYLTAIALIAAVIGSLLSNSWTTALILSLPLMYVIVLAVLYNLETPAFVFLYAVQFGLLIVLQVMQIPSSNLFNPTTIISVVISILMLIYIFSSKRIIVTFAYVENVEKRMRECGVLPAVEKTTSEGE